MLLLLFTSYERVSVHQAVPKIVPEAHYKVAPGKYIMNSSSYYIN
jgi:hypothetical protein